MVDLRSQYLRIKKEIDDAIQRVLSSTAFIQGKEVSEFATALGKYVWTSRTSSHAPTAPMHCKLQ